MTETSSSDDLLRTWLLKYNSMAEEGLNKGAGPDKDLVAQLQKEMELLQEIDRRTSGEVQRHGSVLCCKASIASAEQFHQHAHSCGRHQGFMVASGEDCRSCGLSGQAWQCLQCKDWQLLCCMSWSRPLWPGHDLIYRSGSGCVKADRGLSTTSLNSCSRGSRLHVPEACHPVFVTWTRPANLCEAGQVGCSSCAGSPGGNAPIPGPAC